jgi:hypothetical protein
MITNLFDAWSWFSRVRQMLLSIDCVQNDLAATRALLSKQSPTTRVETIETRSTTNKTPDVVKGTDLTSCSTFTNLHSLRRAFHTPTTHEGKNSGKWTSSTRALRVED